MEIGRFNVGTWSIPTCNLKLKTRVGARCRARITHGGTREKMKMDLCVNKRLLKCGMRFTVALSCYTSLSTIISARYVYWRSCKYKSTCVNQ